MKSKRNNKLRKASRKLTQRQATKHATAGETPADVKLESVPSTPQVAIPANGEIIIPPPTPESIAPSNGEADESQIREAEPIKGKPHFFVRSKSVINLGSDFIHKLLCDGLTFTPGHACIFSCSFCYVVELMRKNAKFNAILEARGLKHEDVVVDIEDAAMMARQALIFADGTPRFADPNDRRVIYASPLVDVAGNMDQLQVTVDICRAILELTHWHIRLLSKSSLLLKVVEDLSDYKDRMIFGFSTGTLENDVTKSFETGTALVSKRLEALKKLQNQGFRTFGMLCPILPQMDYREYAKKATELIDIKGCEHIWAEVLNPRGDAMMATSKGLRKAGFTVQADLMDMVANDPEAWNKYAETTFLALAEVIPTEKLRFLQYVDQDNYHIWKKHEAKGAVLLGEHAKRMNEVLGDVEVITPLDANEKAALQKCEAIVHEGVKQFVKVGLALNQIVDQKLYRGTHSTFDAYCLSRFDFGRGYGYRLIKSALELEKLKPELKLLPNGDSLLPTSESQVRELLKVEPENRVRVLQNAAKLAGGKPMNALLIECAAAELKPAAASKPVKEEYPAPATYTTDLKVFSGWLATLQNHMRQNEMAEVQRLLTKAQANQAIIPEMPAMITFADPLASSGWLSAMSPHPIKYENLEYPTAEALFQCLRFDGHPDIQKAIMAQKSSVGVTLLVRKNRDRLPGFDSEANLKLMRLCLNLKVEQHQDLKDRLRATGDKLIVDDCTTRAKGEAFFWGMALINGQWVGENWLGKLWMELRDKLNKE